MVEVFCHAARQEIFRRFVARAGTEERHSGHPDVAMYPLVYLEGVLNDHNILPARRLGLGPVHELDTTDFATLDWPSVMNFIDTHANE
jgi:hypothetical protein